jgi:hypothetical protein
MSVDLVGRIPEGASPAKHGDVVVYEYFGQRDLPAELV